MRGRFNTYSGVLIWFCSILFIKVVIIEECGRMGKKTMLKKNRMLKKIEEGVHDENRTKKKKTDGF